MIYFKLKSDLQMTPNLILSLNLVKWLLIWLAVKVIIKNNYPKTLLLPYLILAMELLVYVDTLATSHKYVLLGQFSTDQLEKEFGKLHQRSGGTNHVLKSCILSRHLYF